MIKNDSSGYAFTERMRRCLGALVLSLALSVLLAPAPDAREAPPREIVARAGTVTLRLRAAPLQEVLDELARQTGAAIVVRGGPDVTITGDVTDLPLATALAQVLGGCSAAAVYPSREALWPSDVRVECGAGRAEMENEEAREADSGIPERLAAIDNLEDVDGARAADLLSAMLEVEADDAVRVQAIRALGRTEHPAAMSALRLALQSESPLVRVNALQSLTVTAGSLAIPFVKDALADPNEAVQAKAEEMLAALGEGPVR